MTASKEQVVSSGKAVSLNFNHCFTNLKINLVPGGDVLAEEMVRDNPRIVATGFYTRANIILTSRYLQILKVFLMLYRWGHGNWMKKPAIW